MLGPEALTRARGLIRETVADPSAWSKLLEDLAEVTGSNGAWLVRETDRTPDAPRTASLNDMLDEYFSRGWSSVDDRIARCVPRFKAGQPIVSDTDVFDDGDRRRSPFHNEFALRHGHPHFAAASFSAGSTLWAISFLRHASAGPFSGADKQGLSLLLQDLEGAATTAALLGRNTLETLNRSLDLVGTPVLALDARGTAVYANGSFTRASPYFGDDLRVLGDGMIVTRDRSFNAALQKLIDLATHRASHGRAELGTLAVQRRDGLPILARAVPLGAISVSPFLGAKVLLFFPVVDAVAPMSAERVRHLLKVTLAEGKLLVRLRAGDTVTGASEALGISKQTARTQLKSVFGKLDVHNQRGLLDLLRQL